MTQFPPVRNPPVMKLTLSHRNHEPSKSIVIMIERELESLLPDLRIDEARIRIERSLGDGPPFSVSIQLVTPGPDIIVKTSGPTLRTAVLKGFERIAGRIGQRRPGTSRSHSADHPSH